MMQSDKLCNKRLCLSQVYDITLRPTGVWLELSFPCLYCIVGVSYCNETIRYGHCESVQHMLHGAQLSERPSTPVPDRLLHPALRSHISAASQICQPTTSGRTTLPTEFFCPTGFLCGRPIGLQLIARVSERPGRPQRQFQETVKDVSVCNVLMHTAH